MTIERTDPYAALGLDPNATQGEIRRAYRTLLRQNHPDTRPMGDPADDAASDRTLQRVIAAYAILGVPARRAGHDQIGPHTTTIPTRIRPGVSLRGKAPDQPPIQAGPVRWHGSRPSASPGIAHG
jgi:curved DNA-binding protein CbpA